MKTKRSKDNYLKAINYFKCKDFDNALFYFNEEIKINPFNPMLYYYIGRIFYYKKEYYKAASYLKVCYNFNSENIAFNFYYGKTLIFIDSDNAFQYLIKTIDKIKESTFYLALLYYKNKNYIKAIQYFKKVPEYILNKEICKNLYSLCYSNIGNEFYFVSNYKEAKSFFIKAVKINKMNYSAHFQIGSIYLIEEDFNNAKKHFEFLYKRFKKSESIKISLSYIYFNLNELEKLEKILKEIKVDKFSPEIDIYELKKILAYILYQRRKYNEAIPLFIQLYNKKRYDENILFYLAQARFKTGNFKKVENIYNLIFDITRKNIFINNSYLLFLIHQKDFKKAEEKAIYFINNNVYNEKTILYLYYSSINNNNFEFRKIYYDYLKKIFNNSTLFLESEALYYFKNNKYSEALFYFYKLYEFDPEDSWILNNIIDILNLENSLELVLHYSEKLYNLQKNNEKIAFFYVYFLIKNSKFEKAIDVLNNFRNHSSEANYLLSDVYFRISNNNKALLHLKESFYKNPLYLPTLFKSLTFFYKKNNLNQALRLCKLIKFTNKDFKRVFIYEALIYFKKGRYDIAIDDIEEYLKLNKEKENPFFKLCLAYLYYFENKIEYAIKIVNHLIKKNKAQAGYLILLSLCKSKRYDIVERKKIEEILKKQFFNSPSFLEYKARYLSLNYERYCRKDLGIRIP